MTSNKGVSALASVLQLRTKELASTPTSLDVGEIQRDMSLLLNHFPVPIPQSDYMVCRSVALGNVGDILYRTQVEPKANHCDHVHDTLVGPKMRWLQSGDRVLVAWFGTDNVCVIDLIYPATEIEKNADTYSIPY